MTETYQALYRKWRPLTFHDVVGQDHVSDTLKNSISSGRIAHAYLFCGTRGTGKTSTAKIFSRAVNCENPIDGDPCNVCNTCKGILNGSILDVYEMDAASNSGVSNIREIRDEVIYTPANSKFKVYIIDEAHMLTTEAFNALLKTLEEPPRHVVFILATTEPHKIPATILSRCQRFDFRRIGIDDISKRINKISLAEGIQITPDASELIAELADGSMRDGLSILDQCAAFGKEELRYADIVDIVGIVDKNTLFEIANEVAEGNTQNALILADKFLNMGKEVLNFFEDLISHYRSLLICKSTEDPADLLERTAETTEKYKVQAEKYTTEQIMYCITVLSEYLLQAKWMTSPQISLEMTIVKICNPKYSSESASLLARIEKLESTLSAISISGTMTNVNIGQDTEKADTETPPWDTESLNSESRFVQPKKEILKKDDNWSLWTEALNIIKNESKSLYAFLFSAKAYESGDGISIVLSNKMAYERIAKPEGIKYLADLFSRVTGSRTKVSVTIEGQTKNTVKSRGPSILDIVKKKDILGDKMTIKGEIKE